MKKTAEWKNLAMKNTKPAGRIAHTFNQQPNMTAQPVTLNKLAKQIDASNLQCDICASEGKIVDTQQYRICSVCGTDFSCCETCAKTKQPSEKSLCHLPHKDLPADLQHFSLWSTEFETYHVATLAAVLAAEPPAPCDGETPEARATKERAAEVMKAEDARMVIFVGADGKQAKIIMPGDLFEKEYKSSATFLSDEM